MGVEVKGSTSLVVPKLGRYQLRAGKGSRSPPLREASVSCCRRCPADRLSWALSHYRRAHASAPLSLGSLNFMKSMIEVAMTSIVIPIKIKPMVRVIEAMREIPLQFASFNFGTDKGELA